MIRCIHVIRDNKFSEPYIAAFDSDKRFSNSSIMYVKSESYVFKYIKQKERITLFWSLKQLGLFLKSNKYDVLIFHSLPISNYSFFKYIPDDKIVIWWAWGYDLYLKKNGIDAIIKVDLYKSLTSLYLQNSRKGWRESIKLFIKEAFLKYYYYHLRRKVISRIDYFQPVLPIEYKLMNNLRGFRAKEFYAPRLSAKYNNIDVMFRRKQDGGVLIGNSASVTNNHLDVWKLVEGVIPSNRDIVIPISYGDMKYANMLTETIKSDRHNIIFLKDFLERNDYFNLLNNCSYAIFGVIRQQAMGNIHYCLRHGIKVFLYKDSIIFRFLRDLGYIVYAIEDINESSFIIPITQEEMEQNRNVFQKQYKYIESVRSLALEDIYTKVEKNNNYSVRE